MEKSHRKLRFISNSPPKPSSFIFSAESLIDSDPLGKATCTWAWTAASTTGFPPRATLAKTVTTSWPVLVWVTPFQVLTVISPFSFLLLGLEVTTTKFFLTDASSRDLLEESLIPLCHSMLYCQLVPRRSAWKRNICERDSDSKVLINGTADWQLMRLIMATLPQLYREEFRFDLHR